MFEEKKCPECGCEEIGKGKLSDYANLAPMGKFFSMGSAILAEVCTNCGLIIRLRAEKPDKFKS